MISLLKHWISKRLAIGGFLHRSDVLRFAASRSVLTTAAAVVFNTAVYQLLAQFTILGVTPPANLMGDTVVTMLVAGPISFLAYYSVGAAIRELSVSRCEFAELSRTDPLTGLMNRRAFVDVVEKAEESYVLAVLDIDRFKTINDTHGHEMGDRVLKQLSEMLLASFGSEDAVARLGGEEFAVILRGKSKQETLASVDRFRAEVARYPFAVNAEEIWVTISAGVSQSDGALGYSVLLRNADRALYLAKAAGRNRVVHADDAALVVTAKGAIENRRAV